MKRVILVTLLMLSPHGLKAEEKHHFWDQTNVSLHLLNLAAQSVDAYSTQRGLSRGGVELNPIARPLVGEGWKGQVAYSHGLGVGGTLAASYLLHRFGRHKWERITPILVATPTGIMGGFNFRF